MNADIAEVIEGLSARPQNNEKYGPEVNSAGA
jgi:hypothetical protein